MLLLGATVFGVRKLRKK
ncbi:hypothetical protein [Seonamhaeicola sp. S2-3]